MAVCLRLHMKRKNHFSMVVFLDRTGRAEVSQEDLMRLAREDAASFPMDYVDLAAGCTGRITAELLSVEEINRALEAHAIYKTMLEYPRAYREALIRARRLAASKASCSIRVEQVRADPASDR
jgi:hypothetical protein